MMEIEKPKITCEETDNGSYARFVVEPLDKGMGITIGNCMRRTLLSALPGAAPIAIRIAGVSHEYSTVKGVVEDVIDIVLNVKSIALRTTNTEPDFTSIMTIKKSGAGVVTAGDFMTTDEVEVLNPDLVICNLDDDANLDMEIIVGRGRGYVPNNVNKERIDNVEYIGRWHSHIYIINPCVKQLNK